MDNPLELPPPEDPIMRIRTLARDLAWGAIQGVWNATILIVSGSDGDSFASLSGSASVGQYVARKWGTNYPSVDLLVSFGYLSVGGNPRPFQTNYIITQKAFELLEKPASLLSIFISYRRDESSAFALLLLHRLKTVGFDPFLDLNIDPGEDWHAHLEEQVHKSQYFICLLGPRTLDSVYVRREIAWALDTHTRIIPIWHNGYTYQNDHPELEEALNRNAIVIEKENVEQYNNAVNRLLNYLGFTPV